MTHLLNSGKTEISYLTFRVGLQWYAVDVLAVFEVVNLVAISPVPDMPESVLGVVNIRGSMAPVIDLRRRFNMPDKTLKLTTPIIFLRHEEIGTYGIVVDDVDDVVNLNPGAVYQTPLTERAEHILGIMDVRERLIMLLDPLKLMKTTLRDEPLFVQKSEE
ncbi:MAG: chemotaxis protein CheW [Anaerolineae bacterium]|nr:chemotaxis protein CheW [Anaerolineae bacterium]